ncbi:rhamnosyltransferase [Acinetobacter soli]|uniref:Rhamnosyltransferase n=1 Tax=Acinetobacter soli TaxID=487316 RepID=A0A1P8ELA7_9GAMM|nr:rhamnosyltransferase [Acinetobacter soli]APV36988.1 rhamnosyltransferase [Acinetobacter soli]
MNLYCYGWAVIVSYNPSVSNLLELVSQLKMQNISVILVDNGSTYRLNENDLGCKLINLEKNEGIAAAQNRGIEYAINHGGKHIIFFDQDSSIPNDYVVNLMNDYQFLINQGIKVGTIGPRFIDERFGFYYKTVNMSQHGFREKIDVSKITQPEPSTLLISSGSLVSVDVLKDIGFMRENYFIDYVDTEWCIRAASLGYKNYVSAQAVMQHTIGDNVLQFRYFNVPVHSPFRRYYRVRNAYYMYREPHVPKLLALREILFNFVHQLILILFLSKKSEYIKSYAKGVKDGLFNYKGHNDD